jgi:hypothetical protein
MEVMSNPIDHPKHYCGHVSGVECIDVVEGFQFNLANVIKYVWRHGSKGTSRQDIEKALWYLRREMGNRKFHQDAQEERATNAIEQLQLKSPDDDITTAVVIAAEQDDLESIEQILLATLEGL